MKITTDISERIRIIRFPLIVGVVFIHSYGMASQYSSETIGAGNLTSSSLFVQVLISHVLAALAVPTFFLVSGYLFFNHFSFDWNVIAGKYRRRIKSLVIPYFLWNALTMLFFLIVQSLPQFSYFFSGRFKFITDYNLYDFFNAFLAFDGYPISYQFWFIHDLIILVAISPLIWLLVTRVPWISVAVFMSLWLINPPQLKYVNLSYVAIFFFLLGGIFSIKEFRTGWMDRHGNKILIAYALMAVTITFLSMMNYIKIDTYRVLIDLAFAPGIVSIWIMAGWIRNHAKVKALLISLSVFSFFVYAAHEPTLTILRKVTFRIVVPSSSAAITFFFFLIPVTVIGITLCVAFYLNKFLPRVYKIVSGSR